MREELRTELDALGALRRSFVALGLAAAAIFAIIAGVAPSDIGKGAHWQASSSYDGNPTSGTLPNHGFFFSPKPYFFHTTAEDTPWLSIDLGREHVVSAVKILNRLDACRERARSASIEVSLDGKSFERVSRHGKHNDAFRTWQSSFAGVRARYVRIVGTKGESLHLADVRIFGR